MIPFLILMLLAVIGPPIAVVRWAMGGATGTRRRLGYAVALFAPALLIYVAIVLVSLAGFEGRCGGWLGETSACAFPEFFGEALFWGILALLTPSALGVLFGVLALTILAVRRRA